MAHQHNIYGARLAARELIESMDEILNDEDCCVDRAFEELFDRFDHLKRMMHLTRKSHLRGLYKRILDLEIQLTQEKKKCLIGSWV